MGLGETCARVAKCMPLAFAIGYNSAPAYTQEKTEPTVLDGPFDPAEEHVDVVSGDERRTVGVYRRIEKQPQTLGRYYFKPMLSFEAAKSPPDGFTSVVHRVDTEENTTYVLLRLRIWSPELRNAAGAVAQHDALLRSNFSDPLQSVTVEPWPVQTLVIEVEDVRSHRLYGATSLKISKSASAIQNVYLPIAKDDLQEFKKKLNDNLLAAQISLTSKQVEYEFGSASTSIERITSAAVENTLRSSILGHRNLIMQEDRPLLKKYVANAVEANFVGTNENFLKSLVEDLDKRMSLQAETYTLQDLAKEDNIVREKFASYLNALVQKKSDQRDRERLRSSNDNRKRVLQRI